MSSSNQKTVLSSLHRFEFILQHELDRILQDEVGIGFSQVRIMDEISATTTRSQREIAMRLHQTEANISRQLKELKQRNLVKIMSSKKDKRQKEVLLSSTGQKRYDAAQKLIATQHKQLLSLIGAKELNTLEQTLNHLSNTISGVN